jgi:HlyD family secretion protein
MSFLCSIPRDATTKAFALLVILVVCGAADTQPADIGGTGNIEPRGGVVLIGGVPGATIRFIKVQAGQRVKHGDLLMALDDDQQRLDEKIAAIALDEAARNAKQSIADEEVSLELARARYRRVSRDALMYRDLGPDATSQRQIASVDAAAEDARGALTIELRKDAQVRLAAATETETAAKRLEMARDELAKYQVTAPNDGVILQINQHEGENVNGAPVIEMGDISSMYVICQVFQGDLLKVKPGMKATITSNALEKSLAGTVEQVGRLIQNTTQTGDVKIKLADTDLASRLVGMEVEVKIAP